MVRGAFTLIELIFAVVVMSIVMLAFPTIMLSDSDAREQNMAQEATLAASAKLAQVLTYQWDEKSVSWEDLAENHQTFAHLLEGTNYSTPAFQRDATDNKRASGSDHRVFFPSHVNTTGIGDDNNTVIGMDDYNGATSDTGLSSGFTAESRGYKRDYQLQVAVLRINDALTPSGGTVDYNQTALTGANSFVLGQDDIHDNPTTNPGDQTNLRCVRVTVSDNSGNVITTLYGYAANIGEYQVYSKVRP